MVNSTIERFLDIAGRHDFARDNLYRVVQVKVEGILEINDDGLMYCKGAKLPKRTNPTGEVPFMGVKFPYNLSTVEYGGGEYGLDFWIDAQSTVLDAFELASRRVFDDLSTTGNWRFPSDNNIIVLQSLDFNLNVTETVKFLGVAFKGFSEIDTKQGEGTGAAISVHGSFSYQRFIRQRGEQATKGGAVRREGGDPSAASWFIR